MPRPFVGFEQFVQNVRLAMAMLAPAKRLLTCLFLPILLIPLPMLIRTTAASCAYVVAIMGYFWVTETLPLAVTALVPVFAFPLLSIDKASAVASVYLSDSNFVFFGSMVMAVAVEASRLHERIALNVLLLTGPNPRWLMLGFQLATAFLSMWISNTATTMMMVPIVVAVIKELDLCHRRESDPLAEPLPDEGGSAGAILDLENVSVRQLNIYKGLLLSICFAASIGGTGTLIGTGSNIVLNAYLQKAYSGQSPVSFASFMFYAIPQALLLLLICWLWLQLLFVRARPSSHRSNSSNSRAETNGIGQMLAKKHEALGPLRYEEKTILATFGVLIFLWLTRQPMVVPGWGNLFPKGYVSDGTAAMAVSMLLFVLPADNPFDGDVLAELLARPGTQLRTVMTWRLMCDKFSWSTLLLLGGGYAMADGVESSGLADWIGAQLASLEQLPDWVFIGVGGTWY
uniref:CitMHS domain-containing protein n=1 Tax=Globodera pallida TaxID=36090 RepID=A0A183BQ96_GLOPA